jgi:hypothetical protein
MSEVFPEIMSLRFTEIFISLPVPKAFRVIITRDFDAHSVGPPAWAIDCSRLSFCEGLNWIAPGLLTSP